MGLYQDCLSPAFSPEEIPVEFLVLHYTACNLENTLRIFCDPGAKTCAHFVLDVDGSTYDLGHFWEGPILRGAHAGVSSFEVQGRKWESFNRFSIGIEIVNLNGNLRDYTEKQYESLAEIVSHLQSRFPALTQAERVVGHEQIAGFRGKADPGLRFDWRRFFATSYPGQAAPERPCKLTPEALARFVAAHGDVTQVQDWSKLSSELEAFLGSK